MLTGGRALTPRQIRCSCAFHQRERAPPPLRRPRWARGDAGSKASTARRTAAARHNGEVTDTSRGEVETRSGGASPAVDSDTTVLADTVHSDSVLSDEERVRRETDLRELIDLMRPAVQADGGDLELVSFDVESGEVEVQLQGACSSCAISSATLQGGVDRILRSRLDWVTEVRGGVDELVDPFDSAALGRGAYVPKY